MLGDEITMIEGLTVTVFSMLLVFVTLLVLSFILDLFKKLFYKPQDKIEAKTVNTVKNDYRTVINNLENEFDLVAALTAVIVASNGENNCKVRIKSITRIN